MNLAMRLHKPKAVEVRMTGKTIGVARQAVLKANAIPNLESRTKTAIALLQLYKKIIMTPPAVPTTKAIKNDSLIPSTAMSQPLTMSATTSERHDIVVLTQIFPGMYFNKNVIKQQSKEETVQNVMKKTSVMNSLRLLQNPIGFFSFLGLVRFSSTISSSPTLALPLSQSLSSSSWFSSGSGTRVTIFKSVTPLNLAMNWKFFLAYSYSPTETNHAGDSTFQREAMSVMILRANPIQMIMLMLIEIYLRKKVTQRVATTSPTKRAVPITAL